MTNIDKDYHDYVEKDLPVFIRNMSDANVEKDKKIKD